MTRGTAFNLNRRMFVNEWSLLVRMTPDARSIGADRKFCLFRFKSAVRVVTVAATHRPFQHFMMEGLRKLRFRLGMARHAELRLALLQLCCVCLICSLRRCRANERYRVGPKFGLVRAVCRVAIGASDIVSPMLAAAEIIVRLFACMTSQASFRDLFRRFS